MSVVDSKIEAFEARVLLPTLREVCGAKRLLKEYEATLITSRPASKPEIEELLSILATNGAPGNRTGPSLALENRDRSGELPALAGRYAMTVVYHTHEDEVFASPVVVFWMRFNGKLHLFNHRYDNAVPFIRLADVTYSHITNHILNSFDFYKIQAFSTEPFPGYHPPR